MPAAQQSTYKAAGFHGPVMQPAKTGHGQVELRRNQCPDARRLTEGQPARTGQLPPIRTFLFSFWFMCISVVACRHFAASRSWVIRSSNTYRTSVLNVERRGGVVGGDGPGPLEDHEGPPQPAVVGGLAHLGLEAQGPGVLHVSHVGEPLDDFGVWPIVDVMVAPLPRDGPAEDCAVAVVAVQQVEEAVGCLRRDVLANLQRHDPVGAIGDSVEDWICDIHPADKAFSEGLNVLCSVIASPINIGIVRKQPASILTNTGPDIKQRDAFQWVRQVLDKCLADSLFSQFYVTCMRLK